MIRRAVVCQKLVKELQNNWQGDHEPVLDRGEGCLVCCFAGCQPVVFGRRLALSAQTHFLPLLLKKGGEGRGEEALFINFPSLRLSPRSFLTGRERQNTASLLRAEHNCSVSRSVSKPIDVLDVPKRWAAGNAPAGHSCQLAGRSQAGAQFES
jgi:hypothetical protein